jgi:peptidyl-prolyl cis-trans isomerase D
MLDIVRRSKGLTRVLLSLVVLGVSFTFVVTIFAVWGGGVTDGVQGAPDWIAMVDGERIPSAEFQQRRATMERNLREQLTGQQLDEETLGALVDQQALGSMLSLFLAQREADRAGLRVVPGEVSETIVNMPLFQRDGRFVGLKTYRDFLRVQGLDLAAFEEQLARELAADKIRLALFSIANVDDTELERRYRGEVERFDVDYVFLADADYAPKGQPGDADLRRWYGEHPDDYMTEETRNASFVLFDREARATAMQIPEEELRQTYESLRASRYTHGEQRRASHILFRLDPAASPDEEDEKEAAANDLLAALRSGSDFAEMARQHSEDSGSAPSGGDLGYFERGSMVPEFEEAAFSSPVGEISDVVKTGFGFHIIKTTDNRPAGSRTFEEVREEIRRDLAVQRAQEEIRQAADAFTTSLALQASSFQATAAEMGHSVEQTGLFSRRQPAGRLGRLPLAEDAIFSLDAGASSAPVTVPQGIAVFLLEEIREPQPEEFESVKEAVAEDVTQSQSRERARNAAERIRGRSGDLKSRISGGDLEARSLAAVTRSQSMPPLTDVAKEGAFAAPLGSVIGPFDTAGGLLVLEVTRRSPSTPAEEALERDALRQRILDEEEVVIYQSLMARLQKTSSIELNRGLLRVGPATP